MSFHICILIVFCIDYNVKELSINHRFVSSIPPQKRNCIPYIVRQGLYIIHEFTDLYQFQFVVGTRHQLRFLGASAGPRSACSNWPVYPPVRMKTTRQSANRILMKFYILEFYSVCLHVTGSVTIRTKQRTFHMHTYLGFCVFFVWNRSCRAKDEQELLC